MQFNKDNAEGAEQAVDGNGEAIQYYIGPYCNPADSYSIHLGVFSDPYCSKQVSSSVYKDELMYEDDLPYSTSALVDGSCIDCRLIDVNQNCKHNFPPKVSDTCEAMYNYAAKCENRMNISSKDNSGCEFIATSQAKVPSDLKTENATIGSDESFFEKCDPQAYAIVFGMAVTFGITTVVLLAAHAYLMQNKDDTRQLIEPKAEEAPENYSSEVSL
jgi:hypothetical protein